MSVPQAITDALNQVQQNADDLTAKQAALVAAQSAASAAAAQAQQAQSAVSTAQAQLQTDAQALLTLIQNTYLNPQPPAPPA